MQHLVVLVVEVVVVGGEEIVVVVHFESFVGGVKEDICLLGFFLDKDNGTYHASSPSNSNT